MKKYLAALSLVLFGFPLVVAGEYPVGLVVYPTGSALVLSTGGTLEYDRFLPITLEPHRIRQARVWRRGRDCNTFEKKVVDPQMAAERAATFVGNTQGLGLEIQFKEPTIQ